MAALTQDRDTKAKSLRASQDYPVAAATEIFKGSMVCLDATGFAIPAADTAGISDVVGVAMTSVNNTGADGDLRVLTDQGVFKMETDAVVANLNDVLQVQDDQTADISGVNNILVGKLREVDADGEVWVECGLL